MSGMSGGYQAPHGQPYPPQQPPQQPQQPPAYPPQQAPAYPPQQPSPYAQQQGYPQQPQPQPQPHGYPAPPPPPGGPGHRGRGGRRGKGPLLAVLAVVLVLALAGGAWVVLRSDDGEGDGRVSAIDPELAGGQVWSATEEGVDDGDSPEGFWVVGETLVKATGTVFTAYAVADGSEVWSLPLEGEHLCAPTDAGADNLLVVGHGENNCGQNITQIDLTTGEEGWSRPLEPNGNPLSFHIAMAGSSYAVQTIGGWSLHNVADGEVIDSAIAGYDALGEEVNYQGAYEEYEIEVVTGEDVCAVTAVAGGEALIRLRTCAEVTDAASQTLGPPVSLLEEIDPATGETTWSVEVPEGRELYKINSVAPLVVTLRDEAFELELAFVEQGTITGQVPIENTGLARDDTAAYVQEMCRVDTGVVYSRPDDCGGMAFHGDRMYASPSTMFSDPIVTAMDAATGEVLWTQNRVGELAGQLVLAADDKGVIVFQETWGEGENDAMIGQIARISPDGQTTEPLFATGAAYIPGSSFADFRDGRLVLCAPDYSLDYDLAAYGRDGKQPGAGADAGGAGGGEGAP